MKLVQPIREKNKILEVKEILEKNSMRDLLLFVLPLNCGMRIGDCLSLKVLDITKALDDKAIDLKEEKTGKRRLFPLNDE